MFHKMSEQVAQWKGESASTMAPLYGWQVGATVKSPLCVAFPGLPLTHGAGRAAELPVS